QHLLAIAAGDQGPAAVAREALDLALETDLEVDDEAACAHPLARIGSEHRATAGGDHQAFALQQVRQRRRFAGAETRLALAFEDGGEGGAGARLDLAVDIDKGQAEATGQSLADRRLACAHWADEHEVWGGIHRPDRSRRRRLAAASSVPEQSVAIATIRSR